MALVGVALDGGGFLVDADDGADVLLQVLVGERDGVAGPEVVAAGRGGRGRGRFVRAAGQAVDHEGGVGQG